MPNESISHCGMAMSVSVWLIKRALVGIHLIQHRLAVKRHFHSLVFACKASASTLSSAATASGVSWYGGPKVWSPEGENKDGEVALAQSLMWSKKEPLRWLTASKPPIVMECKTHMRTQIHAQQYFLFTFLLCHSTPLYTHKQTSTRVPCRTDERKLMLDQCLVQEADLAVWLVWLSPGETGSEKVNEGLIY